MKTTTKTKTQIKVIHETKIVGRERARLTRIFEFNEKKFKLVYDLRNGVSDLSTYIMDLNGEFKVVLNKYDIGHEFKTRTQQGCHGCNGITTSYVSGLNDKEIDIKKAVKLTEEVVIKIYS